MKNLCGTYNSGIATKMPLTITVCYSNAGGIGCVLSGSLNSSCTHPKKWAWHTTSTTRYYAPNFEREVVGGKTTDHTYINSPNGLIAAVKRVGNKQDLMLLATDHLGSIIGVWNASGTLLEEHRYTAWGSRTSSTQNPRLQRGFTGHEHLQQFGLIDMQARMYDLHLGHFLAPDPYVQAPENPMNYNRYAYCFNNPLKYTDPTGCFTEEEFREILNEMHRLLDEANRMDQQLCVSFNGFGGGASGFGSVGGQLYSYDNGVASLTDMGMPFYHMHEGATVHGRYNADGSWTTTRVDLPSWWGTVPDVGGNSPWSINSTGSWNANWTDNGFVGGGGSGGTVVGGGYSGGGAGGVDTRTTPTVGAKWQSGMPTVYGNGPNALVVSTLTNKYVNIDSKELYWQYADVLKEKGKSFKYHPINTTPRGTSMMLLELLLVPSIVPLPNPETKKIWDEKYYEFLIYYYSRDGLIKP